MSQVFRLTMWPFFYFDLQQQYEPFYKHVHQLHICWCKFDQSFMQTFAFRSWTSEVHRLSGEMLHFSSCPCWWIQRKVYRVLQRFICHSSSQFHSLFGQLLYTTSSFSGGSLCRTLLHKKISEQSSDRPSRGYCIIKNSETLCAA